MNLFPRYQIALFIIIGILLSSCSAGKKVIKNKELDATEALIKSNLSQEREYEWFTAKAKANIDAGSMKVSGDVIIRMKKDSLIWMVVRKFGIEVARVKIEPTTVLAVVRFNSSYLEEDLESFADQYNIPLDFYQLQKLILADPILESEQEIDIKYLSDRIAVNTTGPSEQFQSYQIDKENYQIQKFHIADSVAQQFVNASYFNYELNELNTSQALQRDYSFSDANEEYSLTLVLSQIEWNQPKSVKIEVPKHYTKM